jgi:hypothetical protein
MFYLLDNPDGISLNITKAGVKIVFIQRTGKEPALKQVASCSLAKIDHAGIEPMSLADRPGQGIRLFRDNHEMNMIAHETISQEPQTMAVTLLPEQMQILAAVIVVLENFHGTNASLRHMMRISW